MVESAGAGNDSLLRGNPSLGAYPLNDRLGGFDSGILNIDGANADLLVPHQPFVMMRHIVFDETGRALNFRNQIGLIPAGVEIAMANLTVILLSDGIIALANMQRDVRLAGKPLYRRIDGHPRPPLPHLPRPP